MNIAFNALSALRGGGQTYIKNILNEIPSNNGVIYLIVNAQNRKQFEPYVKQNIKIIEPKLASINVIYRTFWEIFILPFWLRKNSIKAYYAPGGIMMTITPKGCKSYTALRNMLPFDDAERRRFPLFSYIRFKLWLLKHVFLISYRLSDGVVFISEHSRNIVKKHLPNIDVKSTIIYHGLNQNFLTTPQYRVEPPLFPNEYYLYVSILDVYKAQKEVVEEWIRMSKSGFDSPLVLVGPKYNEYGEEVNQLIRESGCDHIHYIGAKRYEELPALYHNAKALVFGSSCECCPNILLEKLAAGKPVICSDIMPMPEFGQDAVLYFNPYTKGSLTKAINLLNQEGNLDLYGKRAKARALHFDWQKTTENTINFLSRKV
ncbi:glycosyltransferase family 4 protein [Thalassotalea mangrovi]|uniref:Glycosyltransferase family 4 protein n=1 Tax=Thalassotalea mangrovi TaxID=2572245 RepID=A0A4U1B6Q6_9GAMM|nr:glycosyltransferase family 1 protein [Thalassotalea mangrovi]TKB46140.1 glycosyltransferase family 4 protein [Thalassotalea mangrovi]